ncbi:MAG: hypothetical protein AM324_010230 [Candidatus Thorarchaeota archaeon SMTZ1-83]
MSARHLLVINCGSDCFTGAPSIYMYQPTEFQALWASLMGEPTFTWLLQNGISSMN